MTEPESSHDGEDKAILSGFITKAEIAQELGVSERTVERWVRLRLLPQPLKMGRSSLFHREALKEHLLARMEQASSRSSCARRRRRG